MIQTQPPKSISPRLHVPHRQKVAELRKKRKKDSKEKQVYHVTSWWQFPLSMLNWPPMLYKSTIIPPYTMSYLSQMKSFCWTQKLSAYDAWKRCTRRNCTPPTRSGSKQTGFGGMWSWRRKVGILTLEKEYKGREINAARAQEKHKLVVVYSASEHCNSTETLIQ